MEYSWITYLRNIGEIENKKIKNLFLGAAYGVKIAKTGRGRLFLARDFAK